MKIALEQLAASPEKKIAINFSISPEELAFIETFHFASPLEVTGELYGRAGAAMLRLYVKATLTLCCDRCLTPFRREYAFETKHRVKRVESGEIDANTLICDNGQLDVSQAAKDDFLLSLPTKFLCRPDCKGLCPVCGADRNVTQCNCNIEEGGAENGSTEE